MEPMTLGSPSSPPSPGGTSPFLPPFLMGETNYSSAGGGLRPSTMSPSPTKGSKHVSFDCTPTVFEIQQTTPVKSPRLSSRHSFSTQISTEKGGGPPTQDLFDTLDSPSVRRKLLAQDDTMESFTQMSSPLVVDVHSNSYNPVLREAMNNTWITVFGFPSSATPFVTAHFAQYGTIKEHRVPHRGNWIHLRYQNILECKRALNNNGKILGDIMIGVVVCKDKDILEELKNKENIPIASSTPDRSSTLKQAGTPFSSPMRPAMPTKSSSVKPFVQAYKIAQSDTEVLSPSNIPRRSTGVVSKALDYVFGW